MEALCRLQESHTAIEPRMKMIEHAFTGQFFFCLAALSSLPYLFLQQHVSPM